MVSEEQLTADRSVPRRRLRGNERRRWWAESKVAATPSLAWKHRGGDSDGGKVATVSARKLAASLWRQLAAITDGGGSVRRRKCVLSLDRLGFEFCSLAPIPQFAVESVTKWDYYNSKAWDDHFESNTTYTRETDTFKARKCVDENKEKCSEIKNLAGGVKRERKNCRNMDMINSNLLRDIAETKSSSMMFIRNLEREKKARKDLENVCEHLAKEIEGSKAQIGALMNKQKRIEVEVEEERKMLQIAEIWREERVQMKIADARLILEDKYAEISNLIADLKAFLRKLNKIEDEDDKRIGDHHDHNGSHNSAASEISAVSLMQSNKGSSGSKIKTAWSGSKDTRENIVVGGSSDRSRRNPHVVRAMKGHIEWPPRGIPIPNRSSGSNRLKATLESQKTLLRNVLKQRN